MPQTSAHNRPPSCVIRAVCWSRWPNLVLISPSGKSFNPPAADHPSYEASLVFSLLLIYTLPPSLTHDCKISKKISIKRRPDPEYAA
jgi:hypothetical protein